MAFNWKCPFCGHAQTVIDEKACLATRVLEVGETYLGAQVGVEIDAICCANEECKQVDLVVFFGPWRWEDHDPTVDRDKAERFRLRPESSARPQPIYIPEPIREDYTQACRIRELSPKASATLSRRCLQGMIRDFCGIVRRRLVDEIAELERMVAGGGAPRGVQADTLDAIDAVRKVGNIGAHMEADIDMIVDVDPGEAQALISLIELLFEDWYVARSEREERLAKLQSVAASKEPQKTAPTPKAIEGPATTN
jgi:hypothetical protein